MHAYKNKYHIVKIIYNLYLLHTKYPVRNDIKNFFSEAQNKCYKYEIPNSLKILFHYVHLLKRVSFLKRWYEE